MKQARSIADVAKPVDARDLKSLGRKGCAGSTPAVRTTTVEVASAIK
jgi:hypothetical protein